MKTVRYVTSTETLKQIRATVETIGEDRLGFTKLQVGTHSVQTSCAMLLYLAKTPVYTIMLIGRWCSDAFLRYIRRQVQEFSNGLSNNMIRSDADNFFNIQHVTYRDIEDPGTRNKNAFSTNTHSLNNGTNRQSAKACMPSFNLWQ